VSTTGSNQTARANTSRLAFNPSTGLLTTTSVSASTLVSTVSTGTAPLTVSSTTVVNNLNADRTDGLHMVSLTQAQYDALGSKDADTIYFITA